VIEHALLRPEHLIGEVEPTTSPMWLLADDSLRMERRKVTYVPGMLKIVDEILVNASDNRQRDPEGMTVLKVTADAKTGRITVYNNGRGIAVKIHEKEKLWVPELIFGNMRRGSNCDDADQHTTGGLHG